MELASNYVVSVVTNTKLHADTVGIRWLVLVILKVADAMVKKSTKTSTSTMLTRLWLKVPHIWLYSASIQRYSHQTNHVQMGLKDQQFISLWIAGSSSHSGNACSWTYQWDFVDTPGQLQCLYDSWVPDEVWPMHSHLLTPVMLKL